MPKDPDPPQPRPLVVPSLAQRILRDLIRALDADMHIQRTWPSPQGTVYEITSRTRPGLTHEVCRQPPTMSLPAPAYTCTCEQGMMIKRFTVDNRHTHCWHVRFVHLFTLTSAERARLFTGPTDPETTHLQHELARVWQIYLARRRNELAQPGPRPCAPFVYALARAAVEEPPGNGS
jgi:hypothetical protein